MTKATMQIVQDYLGRIKELEKENEELKHNKKTVAHLADCLEEKMKERIEKLERENAELKAHIKADCIDCADYIKIKKLEKENAELKRENQELKEQYAKECEDVCYVVTSYNKQLTKAKEIIKDLMSFPIQLCDCRYTVDFDKTRENAEQFLKEIEK